MVSSTVGEHNHPLCTNPKGLLDLKAVPLYFALSSRQNADQRTSNKRYRMNIDIYRRFNTLRETKNTQQRGKEFERWFYQMLFQSGWDVRLNPLSAKPRQTDLIAKRGGLHLLLELKWRTKPTDVDHLDSLHSRLHRVQQDVIGCLVSMSGFTKTVIDEIEKDREILLFDGLEIEALARSPKDFQTYIELKRTDLRDNAKVAFFDSDPTQTVSDVLQNEYPLPYDLEKLILNKNVAPNVFMKGDIHRIVFARDIPELDWHPVGDWATSLYLEPKLYSLQHLKSLIALVDSCLHLSGEGSFSVRHLNESWHGIGVANFIQALDEWEKRYDKLQPEYIHHSEDFTFYSACESGFIVLTGRNKLRHNDTRYDVDHIRLDIRLPGIPLDPAPLFRLAKESGHTQKMLRVVDQKTYQWKRFEEPIRVKHLGFIWQDTEHVPHPYSDLERDEIFKDLKKDQELLEAITGIIIENPYYQKKIKLPKEWENKYPFEQLYDPELLVCYLGDWHNASEQGDYYVLRDMAVCWTYDAVMIRPVCTWNKLIKKAVWTSDK